ncbi:uncharacterized protein LOC117422122 isoform X1 [Acipenser ruthenus]|uniref:uncharacterized protein LOC117422122 isoform X1 n=1 Tax=Acipenser ruthenus TaxID=7906 RepID=UPI0027403750|nr:uncharacterized protein LOC117422122 isoform X1 [Acipenser ruthenus]
MTYLRFLSLFVLKIKLILRILPIQPGRKRTRKIQGETKVNVHMLDRASAESRVAKIIEEDPDCGDLQAHYKKPGSSYELKYSGKNIVNDHGAFIFMESYEQAENIAISLTSAVVLELPVNTPANPRTASTETSALLMQVCSSDSPDQLGQGVFCSESGSLEGFQEPCIDLEGKSDLVSPIQETTPLDSLLHDAPPGAKALSQESGCDICAPIQENTHMTGPQSEGLSSPPAGTGDLLDSRSRADVDQLEYPNRNRSCAGTSPKTPPRPVVAQTWSHTFSEPDSAIWEIQAGSQGSNPVMSKWNKEALGSCFPSESSLQADRHSVQDKSNLSASSVRESQPMMTNNSLRNDTVSDACLEDVSVCPSSVPHLTASPPVAALMNQPSFPIEKTIAGEKSRDERPKADVSENVAYTPEESADLSTPADLNSLVVDAADNRAVTPFHSVSPNKELSKKSSIPLINTAGPRNSVKKSKPTVKKMTKAMLIGLVFLGTIVPVVSVDACIGQHASLPFPYKVNGLTSVSHKMKDLCYLNVSDVLAGSCVSCSDLQLCLSASLYPTLHFPSVSERHRGRYTVSWEVIESAHGLSDRQDLKVKECVTVPVPDQFPGQNATQKPADQEQVGGKQNRTRTISISIAVVGVGIGCAVLAVLAGLAVQTHQVESWLPMVALHSVDSVNERDEPQETLNGFLDPNQGASPGDEEAGNGLCQDNETPF